MNTLAIVAYFAACRAVAVIVKRLRGIVTHKRKEQHHD
jgi:uncharacterized membrane protein